MRETYWQHPIALPTLHGKQALIAPVLEPATGCTVVHVADVDTDRFGSFTRELPRTGTQLEAARAKARAALAHSGLNFALASEGAFVADPMAGLTLVFLAVLRAWHKLRKRHWCGDLVLGAEPLAVWAWSFEKAWSDDQLERLIAVLQSQAPDTRVLLLDPESASAGSLRWHPFATCWALVGPEAQMQRAQDALLHSQTGATLRHAPMLPVPPNTSAAAVRPLVASLALQGWSALQQSSSQEPTT